MAPKIRDPGYSAEKSNNISEINISLDTHFSASGFVNGTPTFMASR